MDDFRSGRVRVLITSDIAARDLDIAGVTHVFTLDLPTQSKAYVHRDGRTACAGTAGTAVSLFTKEETRLARRYHEDLGITPQEVPLREAKIIPVRAGFA